MRLTGAVAPAGRGLVYFGLTGAVGAAYVGAVVLANLVLRGTAITESPAFPVAFTLAVLVFFNPIRRRLQAMVDRLVGRTRYDGAQVLATVGADLASALTREHVAAVVRRCIDETIPNAGTKLFVDDPPREVGGTAAMPPPLIARLAEGRVVSAFDRDGDRVLRPALAALNAEIAVPIQRRGALVGALTVGSKRSGLFYGGPDLEFLRALAHQAAIALQNATSYEALVAVNRRLEERVQERTEQLEVANEELAHAVGELKTAQVQLVHSEKMAALGRLVAGVAHEINNPVSFIATSVAPLRRRLEQAAAEAPADVVPVLKEAEEIVDTMERGAERTAAIVQDLRAFSRLEEATRKPVDLNAGLETAIRLLEPRWKGRIEIHRALGVLPLVECDAGQLNQVFLNVLANACDAIRGAGNAWVTTSTAGDVVTVAIRDDGPGMAPEVAAHVFDPFFTTKDVGQGTGLGLAISQSLVAAHGGRIDVETAPAAGATFRITLPIRPSGARLDKAAGSSR